MVNIFVLFILFIFGLVYATDDNSPPQPLSPSTYNNSTQAPAAKPRLIDGARQNVQGAPAVNSTPENVPAYQFTPVKIGANSARGLILTDTSGRSLYTRLDNTQTPSTSWLPYLVDKSINWNIPVGALYKIEPYPDKREQWTYRGKYLFYFQADTRPGDVNGADIEPEFQLARP